MSDFLPFNGDRTKLANFTLEQLDEHLRGGLGDVNENVVDFILNPYVDVHRETLAVLITKIAMMMQNIIQLTKYTRELEEDEGWYLDVEQHGYIWMFTLTLQRSLTEEYCSKELMFRFSPAILEPSFTMPAEGTYNWPELISKRQGIITLESAQEILKFFKEWHPKAEYVPLTEVTNTVNDEMVPVGRGAKFDGVCYTASVLVNSDDFEWQLVED
jgi:hypothetical protein